MDWSKAEWFFLQVVLSHNFQEYFIRFKMHELPAKPQSPQQSAKKHVSVARLGWKMHCRQPTAAKSWLPRWTPMEGCGWVGRKLITRLLRYWLMHRSKTCFTLHSALGRQHLARMNLDPCLIKAGKKWFHKHTVSQRISQMTYNFNETSLSQQII